MVFFWNHVYTLLNGMNPPKQSRLKGGYVGGFLQRETQHLQFLETETPRCGCSSEIASSWVGEFCSQDGWWLTEIRVQLTSWYGNLSNYLQGLQNILSVAVWGFLPSTVSCWFIRQLHSLQLTASLHLKINGWKMKFPFGIPYFQGRAVSFGEGTGPGSMFHSFRVCSLSLLGSFNYRFERLKMMETLPADCWLTIHLRD